MLRSASLLIQKICFGPKNGAETVSKLQRAEVALIWGVQMTQKKGHFGKLWCYFGF